MFFKSVQETYSVSMGSERPYTDVPEGYAFLLKQTWTQCRISAALSAITMYLRTMMQTYPDYYYVILMTSSNRNISALLALCAGIHRSPVNSPHKGQWLGALMFSLICAWINDWVNNRGAGDLRRHRTHYEVTVMYSELISDVQKHIPANARWSLVFGCQCIGLTSFQWFNARLK